MLNHLVSYCVIQMIIEVSFTHHVGHVFKSQAARNLQSHPQPGTCPQAAAILTDPRGLTDPNPHRESSRFAP